MGKRASRSSSTDGETRRARSTSIGTSSQVYPAAQLPYDAERHGALVIEINPQPTPLSDEADFALHAPSGQVLPDLLAALSSFVFPIP